MKPARPGTDRGRPLRRFNDGRRRCPDCGCRLSRYNPDRRCNACAQRKGRVPSTGKGGRDGFAGRVTNTTRARKEETR